MLAKKHLLSLLVVAAVAAGAAYYYRAPLAAWLGLPGETSDAAKVPDVPKAPKDADAQLEGMYEAALKAHADRLAKPDEIRSYMSEGLEWKTVGDFAKTDRNLYYEYAAFVYTEAANKFPTEWVPWLNVGNMFMMLGSYGRAEQAFKKAVEIDSTRYEPLFALLDMISNFSVAPNDEIKTYFRTQLPKVGNQRTEMIISYVRYILGFGANDEALEIMRLATAEWDPKDARLKAEYADLKKALKK